MPLRVTLASEALTCGAADADCMLLDTTGELQRWYGIATVVFIGKSLTAHGGQNPVEPILAGKPVVFGPHMENFATLAKTLVSNNAAMQVNDTDSLERTVGELLRDSESRQRLVENAHAALNEHKGGTARTASWFTSSPRPESEELDCATCRPKFGCQFALRRTMAIPILPGFLTLSSRGPGHRPFTAVTRVRIPLGSFGFFIGKPCSVGCGMANQTQSRMRSATVLQPFTPCCDSRLTCRAQRDRDAGAPREI